MAFSTKIPVKMFTEDTRQDVHCLALDLWVGDGCAASPTLTMTSKRSGTPYMREYT